MARLFRISSLLLALAAPAYAMMVFPFSYWQPYGVAPPSPPAWQMGALGNKTQTGGTLSWNTGTTYDYNNLTLDGVTITINGTDGNPPLIGVLGNLSMSNCTVNGLNNQDFLYDGSGNTVTAFYDDSPPGGPPFDYEVITSQGAGGGEDSYESAMPGNGLWGSGGGGASGYNNPNNPGFDATIAGGGAGGDGTSPGGTGGLVFGSIGGDGVDDLTYGSGGAGGALGISGQSIEFAIWGNVTSFSSNTFNLYGQDGGDGGAGGADYGTGAGSDAGGGGGGAGGFGGLAEIFIHGTGSGLISGSVFNVSGGMGGLGGAEGNGGVSGAGPGTPGQPGGSGQDGQLIVGSY